ncbi:MAG: bile acid:sodium symporter [Planctomycetes bacterium]|nr:bile acid:sodium symporter [Planctomycetota bacterium]
MRWLIQSWFLVALVILLPGGMAWGWVTTEAWRQSTVGRVHPGSTTIAILFLMAFSLNSSRLRDSFRSPGPVVWGTIVNIGILPLLAWPLACRFSLPDFSLGLMIAAVVPCTLATASVSTRQAGGNDAVSLLITLLTNLISVGLTPLWLKWTISMEANIDPWPVIANLTMTVLLPTIAGQVARSIPPLGRVAVAHRMGVSIAAQCLVLVIVTKAAVEAGGRLQTQSTWPAGMEFLALIAACAGVHTVSMWIAEWGGRWLGLPRFDRIATVFAGSQKTLPVGLLLASMPAITGELSLPFITFPILLFHAVQLMLDTAIADQIAKRTPVPAAAG